MPKLAAKDRKKVEKAEAVSGEFKPMPPGKYVGTLQAVEAKSSAAGNPMWVAEFGDIVDLEEEAQPGRLWYNLNLPTTDTPPEDYVPKGKKSKEESWATYQQLCSGRIKSFFEAFGYTVDTDTDEMIGEQVVLQVGVRTIQNGNRKGEQTNSVNGVAALDTVDFEGGGTADESDF